MVKAFVDDLREQGNFDSVLLMTFSEFGRRVAENANGGTDHGAAAPMFVLGSRIKSGLLETPPGRAPDGLLHGDLKFTVDFRFVYARCSKTGCALRTRRFSDGSSHRSPFCKRWLGRCDARLPGRLAAGFVTGLESLARVAEDVRRVRDRGGARSVPPEWGISKTS